MTDNIGINFIGGNQPIRQEALSGNNSINLDKENSYGLFSKYSKVKATDQYILTVWRKNSKDKAGIFISVESNNKFYNINNMSIEINSFGWNKIVPNNCNGLDMGIYIWNPDK